MTRRFKSMGQVGEVKYCNVTTFPCNTRRNILIPDIPMRPLSHSGKFSVAIEASPTFGHAIQIFLFLWTKQEINL